MILGLFTIISRSTSTLLTLHRTLPHIPLTPTCNFHILLASIQRSRNKHKLFTQCTISPALVARGARLPIVRSLRVLSQLNLYLIACDSAVLDSGTETRELRRACHGRSKGERHNCDRSNDNKQTVCTHIYCHTRHSLSLIVDLSNNPLYPQQAVSSPLK